MTQSRPGTVNQAVVRVQIVAPLDPNRMAIGGIGSFVRGFVKLAPPDFALELVGTTSSAPLGAWRTTTLEGREIRHLPVAGSRERRGGIPLAATFTFGLARYARRIPGGRVLQFHRPGTAIPMLRRNDPKTRVVHLTTADLTSAASESTWRRLGRPLQAIEHVTLQRMDRIYVVNEHAADAYRARNPGLAARIAYVPNWVDDEIFTAPDDGTRHRAAAALRSELAAGPDARVLLFAGRLESQKDPLLALRGVAAAARRREGGQSPDLHLVIAGEGSLRAALAAEARSIGLEGRVAFVGAVERTRLARLMAGADAFVITSAFETGPTVGLEALATGLPVVTTPVGTVGHLVATEGCGASVAQRTPEAVGLALRAVLATPAATLRSAAHRAIGPYRAAAVLPRLYDDARGLAAAAGMLRPA